MFDELADSRFISDELLDIFGRLLDLPIKFLQEEMGDSDWIPYWLWELDCGKAYDDGMVTDADGKEVRLKTIDDLYDVIKGES